jgi:hypothetical protein
MIRTSGFFRFSSVKSTFAAVSAFHRISQNCTDDQARKSKGQAAAFAASLISAPLTMTVIVCFSAFGIAFMSSAIHLRFKAFRQDMSIAG